MNCAFSRSRKSRNRSRVAVGSCSLVPRARRSAMYCLSSLRKAVIAHLPWTATVEQPRAMPRRPPGNRRMWSFESDAEVLPQSPVERLHGESSALLSHGGTGGRRHARIGESPLARAPGEQCAPLPPAPSDQYAAPTFARRFVVIDCRPDPCGGRRPRLRRSPAAAVSALPCGPSHGRRSRRSASRYRPVATKRSRPRADQVLRGEAGSHSPDVPGASVGRLPPEHALLLPARERRAE